MLLQLLKERKEGQNNLKENKKKRKKKPLEKQIFKVSDPITVHFY
jgi:hypothetical protein